MAGNSPQLAERLAFGFRREMAKRFGYVEPYGRKGGWCVRFQIEGKIERIKSVQLPSGKFIGIRSRETAEEILEEIRADIRRTGDVLAAIAPYIADSSLMAVERRWSEFCDVQRQRTDAGQLSKKRLEELEGHLDRGHLDSIRGKSLHSIGYGDLEKLQLELFDQKLKPKTVHNVLADVRTFLRWCERRGVIVRTPEIPLTQLDEYEPTIPTLEEQKRRLAAIPKAARGYFLARGLLGIRQAEAVRARVEDYRRRDSGDEISIRGKGRRFRVLPVPVELATWIRENRPAIAEAGTPLFPNPRTGGEWTMSSLIREWRRMERKLGLAHVKPNEALRHCFGTRTAERLMLQGMTRDQAQAAVMQIMGHTSKATSDRYVKLAASAMRGTIE